MGKDYDPRMHSAEHILNQTMVRLFNRGRSFSTHIEKKKSKCDYRFDRNLTPVEVAEIERRVNEVITTDAPVFEEFLTRQEAAERFNLERLPESVGDSVRIIRIGSYDACPCIGQHVRSTRDIGTFKIVSTGFENGTLRVRFRLEDHPANP
jgi:misacylated tRNA(Ala) deacylase